MQLAEDAVQETFLAVFRGRMSFRTDQPFRPWLWTIHKNVCDVLAQKEQRREVGSGRSNDGSVDVDAVEERLLVRELLERLPAEQAEAVRLRFFGSLTYDEIAAVQECPTPTAKNRVRYALAETGDVARRIGTDEGEAAMSERETPTGDPEQGADPRVLALLRGGTPANGIDLAPWWRANAAALAAPPKRNRARCRPGCSSRRSSSSACRLGSSAADEVQFASPSPAKYAKPVSTAKRSDQISLRY